MKKIPMTLFAAACVAAASSARALPFTDKLSVELFAGGNVAMPGSFRGPGAPFESSSPAGEATYGNLDFEDAYSNRVSGGAELGYSLSEHLSAFARAAYNEFDGDRVTLGQFAPTDEATRSIGASFGDTATREFDLGMRYTFAPWHKVSPFAGAALGATHLAATRAEVDDLDGFGTTSVELGKRQTVFSQRAEVGLQISPLRAFDLRLTAAADHLDAERRSDDPNLALLGLDNSRGDVREHWDYPVELGAVWKF